MRAYIKWLWITAVTLGTITWLGLVLVVAHYVWKYWT